MGKCLKNIEIKNVKIGESLIGERINTIIDKTIPYQWLAINDKVPDKKYNNTIRNFKIVAGEETGEYEGTVFQDSDVAKWIEGAAYSLVIKPDSELERNIDAVINTIVKAQMDDGYLNTYYTLKEPGRRLTNLCDKHELYSAGHMMEAAVAYYRVTGKRKLLDSMCKFADYIDRVLGAEEGKTTGYDGHEEVELALFKLYQNTGNQKYLKLASYFIDERGKKPYYFILEALAREEKDLSKLTEDIEELKYYQSHIPVKEQTEAVGHAVRAMYLYSGLTDIAYETNNEELKVVCNTLWEDVTTRKMYITGSIGSSAANGEAFTFAYDLPNDTAYAETCAAIGLVFWAQRMLNAEPDGKYSDVIEKALYNGILSGISLDGQKYFYVNPLSVWPDASEKRVDRNHVKSERQGWYRCSCCPPNVVRLLTSIGEYIYSYSDTEIYVNLYNENESKLQLKNNLVSLKQRTGYPYAGDVEITVNPEKSEMFVIAIRIPGWCKQAKISINGELLEPEIVKGYAKLNRVWASEDKISIEFDMPVEKTEANPNVRMNVGKVALQRGPIVYCIEEVDNGGIIDDIYLTENSKFEIEVNKSLLGGTVIIKTDGVRSNMKSWNNTLYRKYEYDKEPCKIKAIPYYLWNNRGKGEMTVWINHK